MRDVRNAVERSDCNKPQNKLPRWFFFSLEIFTTDAEVTKHDPTGISLIGRWIGPSKYERGLCDTEQPGFVRQLNEVDVIERR